MSLFFAMIMNFQNCTGKFNLNRNPSSDFDSSKVMLSDGAGNKIWGLDYLKRYSFGTVDNSSSEFAGSKPIVYVQDPETKTADFKQWIGYSTCPGCPTEPQYQTILYGNLIIGNVYEIDIYPNLVSTPPTIQDPNTPVGINYEVLINAGAVDFLDESNILAQNLNNKKMWRIRFIARSNVLQLSIGTKETSVSNYVYIDAYEFFEFGPFKAPEFEGRFMTFAHIYQTDDNFYLMHGVARLFAGGKAEVSLFFVDSNETRPRYAAAPGIPYEKQCTNAIPFLYVPAATSFSKSYETTWWSVNFNSIGIKLLDVGFVYSTDVDSRLRMNPTGFRNSAGFGFLSDSDPREMSAVDYLTIPNHTEYVGASTDYHLNRPLIFQGAGFNPAAFPFSENFAQPRAPCASGTVVYAFNQTNPMGNNLGNYNNGGHSSWLYFIKNSKGVVDRVLIIENSTKASEPGKFYHGISRGRAI